jgi:S-adenosylmethionine-diacylgycerolhomoserine-N-methlytransferase
MTLTEELHGNVQRSFAPAPITHRQRRREPILGRYDEHDNALRKRSVPGQEDLLSRLPVCDDGVWIDLGAGANLEILGDRIRRLNAVYVVDQSPALLRAAECRAARHGWANVIAVREDVARLPLRIEEADVVTFAYSLTQIPDWYTALENAWRLLKPNGLIGIVDYYVARKHPKPGFARHDAWTRWFWPWWFAAKNVFLNADHIPYLHQLFEPMHFAEHRSSMTRLPLPRAPYYVFVGQK